MLPMYQPAGSWSRNSWVAIFCSSVPQPFWCGGCAESHVRHKKKLRASDSDSSGQKIGCGHPSPGPCHACWETFYIFAYCGLVVDIQIHLTAKKETISAPLPTSSKLHGRTSPVIVTHATGTTCTRSPSEAGPRRACALNPDGTRRFRARWLEAPKWPWVKIQIVPPVNIPIQPL